MIILIDKIIKKIAAEYRKSLFRERTRCKIKNLKVLGTIDLVNTNIVTGEGLSLHSNVALLGDGKIQFGKNVSIGKNVIIYASKDGGITIGDNVQIAPNCHIIDVDHGIAGDKIILQQENTVAPIKIGNDVWVASTCVILKGSVLEDGVVIGAHSLVKGHIEANSICCGIPAKLIKKRTN